MDREEFLTTVIDVAEKVGGTRHAGYIREVMERLRFGAVRFGANAYLDRDNLDEVLNEVRDVGAYVVLELDRLETMMERDEDWQEMRMCAMKVCMHAALADLEAHRFRRMRDELVTERVRVGASSAN
jgi:uncharacterized protein with von Willebrand factor type A (vWA) domain